MRPGKVTTAISLILLVVPAAAGIRESALSKLQGYTIVGVMTITGYVDKDGKVKDNFEGCVFDRKIVFEGGKVLRCTSYGYHSAFRPDAVLLTKNGSLKMLVDGNDYDMTDR